MDTTLISPTNDKLNISPENAIKFQGGTSADPYGALKQAGYTTAPPVQTGTLASQDLLDKKSFLDTTTKDIASQADKNTAAAAAAATAKQQADALAAEQALKQQEIDNKKATVTGLNQETTYDPATGLYVPTSYGQTSSSQTPTSSFQDINNQIDQTYTKYQNQINTLNNTTFALTPDQQASINALQAQFDQLKQQQIQFNKNYEGGVTAAGIVAGRSRYAPEIAQGQIKAAVDEGVQKVAAIEAKAAQAIQQMKSGFEQSFNSNLKDKYDIINNSYNAAVSAMKEKSDIIQKMNDQIQKSIDNDRQARLDAQKVVDDEQKRLYDQTTKPIQDISAEAAKYGASPDVIAKINAAQTPADAIAAASGYLQDPTSTGGQYSAYVQKATQSGQTPIAPQEWLAAKNLLEKQKESDIAVKQALRIKAGEQAITDASATTKLKSTAEQQKLEEQGRQQLKTELTSRSQIGVQNNKVTAALSARTLLDQAKVVDANGNVSYDPAKISAPQYGELAASVAALLSGTGTITDSARETYTSPTAAGDINKALTYFSGTPKGGTTADILKNLADTIEREGTQAQNSRDTYDEIIRSRIPSDLDPARKDYLLKEELPSFTNPEKNAMSPDQVAAKAESLVTNFGKTSPENDARVKALFAAFPNATMTDIYDKLKTNGYVQ